MNRTAILIIDVQRGFINEYTQDIPRLAEQKQLDYDFIWVVRLEYSESSPFLTIRKRAGFVDTPNPTELAFTPRPGANILVKHGYSAVTPELLDEFKKHNITQIDLMGVDTDQCVLATALALFDKGITPRILASCCASTSGPEMHKAGLAVMRRALGRDNIVA
jgi:nicotinamidase-related amidase